MENRKKVVVGLSGGVDSSVTAYLMQQQGYDVIGLFMRNWSDDSVTIDNECPWVDDSNDALIVAQQLNIPFQVVDLSAIYKERIVDYMFHEYEIGRTPNPDVLCNREIKFDIFLKTALSLGADYVATGHYCRKEEEIIDGETVYKLLAGKDPNKDQSYFLCQLTQEQLKFALFPIGALQKSEVRAIAAEAGLMTAGKKDSQGLCFIGKVRLPEFLQQQLVPKEGNVVEIPSDLEIFPKFSYQFDQVDTKQLPYLAQNYQYRSDLGKIVGRHKGAFFYTIGQRKGLGIGGYDEPLLIIGTDTQENIIYVGKGENHPGLNRPALFISNQETHWIRTDLSLNIGEQRNYLVRIRYRQGLEKACLYQTEDGLYIVFENLQRGIASGQFAAWYEEEELIGSGVIN
ncbi:MAG TPA: tRNA 2-thiouridine(34) synthase MnmA [Chitinophagales bacterium]|nr:tRNA 2-thiouridine(34) synthase MnmA [Chitinophagales bacterium]